MADPSSALAPSMSAHDAVTTQRVHICTRGLLPKENRPQISECLDPFAKERRSAVLDILGRCRLGRYYLVRD